MQTIAITDVDGARRQVVARTVGSNGQADARRGNLDESAGTRVRWRAENTGRATRYEVWFYTLGGTAPVWPFVEKADGSGTAPAGYTGPLVLAPPGPGNTAPHEVPLTLKSIDAESVKYVVRATPPPNEPIADLDPMIVIRPVIAASTQGSDGGVLLGVVSAILGATVGALAMALMLD